MMCQARLNGAQSTGATRWHRKQAPMCDLYTRIRCTHQIAIGKATSCSNPCTCRRQLILGASIYPARAEERAAKRVAPAWCAPVMHGALKILSRSFVLRHRAWMQADAVSQRAVRVLVPRPLNCRVSDAVSMHVAARNGGASVRGQKGRMEHRGH